MRSDGKPTHLIFYDGTCGLCDHSVQFVLKHDVCSRFIFAPLQGKTAGERLKDLPEHLKNLDTVILIEDFQGNGERLYFLGKAALRVLWLLGGIYAVPGSLSFLPSFLYNFAYRFVARRRNRFFAKISCVIPDKGESGRFLP